MYSYEYIENNRNDKEQWAIQKIFWIIQLATRRAQTKIEEFKYSSDLLQLKQQIAEEKKKGNKNKKTTIFL